MKKIKKNLKLITLISVLLIIIGGVYLKISLFNEKKDSIIIEEQQNVNEPLLEIQENLEEEIILKTVYVDIKGAIQKPGVYEITEDKKVIDVVELAGGFNENADTTMINLAKKVSNEMVIIIYTKEEIENSKKTDTVVKIIEKECICPEVNNDACLKTEEDSNSVKEETKEEKININNATLEDLLGINGIGESKAKAIIEYREKHGKFQKIEDIMEVTGIGESLYEKIKVYITI